MLKIRPNSGGILEKQAGEMLPYYSVSRFLA